MLLGFDLSPGLCGWCAGDGAEVPLAGAFALTDSKQDYGVLGAQFQSEVMALHRRFPAEAWGIERPLLIPMRDSRHTLIRNYGVFFLLCTLAAKLDIQCRHFDVSEVKLEMGSRKLDKAGMIRMALRLGIALPKTTAAGRDDAADAAGVWKCMVRHFAKRHLSKWDTALYSNSGLL